VDDDRYMSVRSLAGYSGLSARTLRSYLIHATDPLPHYRVGGKILIRRSEFDAWARRFRVARPSVDIDTLVGDLVSGLR
jgi:excisionase family DNA binding protein